MIINIFGTEKNLKIVQETINRYNAYGYLTINVYCPEINFLIFKKRLTGMYSLYSDSSLDENNNFFNKLQKYYNKGFINTVGWYYQQYLKLKSVELSSGIIVIIDGDSFLDPKYLDHCIKNKIISTSNEDVSKYNSLLDSNGFTINKKNISYITNFGIISSELFRKKILSVDQYFQQLINYAANSKRSVDISEYQIFGNMMVEDGWKMRPLKFFRRGDLLLINLFGESFTISMSLLCGYKTIAFEHAHRRGLLKILLAQIIFLFNYSW